MSVDFIPAYNFKNEVGWFWGIKFVKIVLIDLS
jgi:hypothetical protein